MKKLFLSLLFILVAIQFESFGQSNLEDVAYLKNGSIIRGLIIEQIPFKSIKIQTRDGSIFVFSLDEIEKITKEKEFKETIKDEFKREGFINITEFSFCPGSGKIESGFSSGVQNKDHSFGVRTINGYQLNPNFSFGLGIGVDKYERDSFMPISLDLRYYILSGKVSPILNANFGYSLGLNEHSGGTIFNPSIGFKIFVSRSISYMFNIGYKWQSREYYFYKFRSNSLDYTREVRTQFYEFVSFNTGFSF